MKIAQKIKDINQGDCLTFKTSDNRFKVIFCIGTNKEKSPQSFSFASTTFDEDFKPTIDDLLDTNFWGNGNRNDFKYSEKEVERMWAYHPNNKPYFLGTYGILIFRKEFMQWKENFELIGKLSIVDNLEQNGSGGFYPGNLDNLDRFFTQDLENVMYQRGQKKFKLKAIVRD